MGVRIAASERDPRSVIAAEGGGEGGRRSVTSTSRCSVET